jgi:tripartite-type tricarboxylate transporter receptor subunit TctC
VAVVGAHSPFKSFKDLIASARANPGKYSYATPGIGSAGWISVQLLINQAKINMVHIPYKGGSQLVTDVAAGQPDFGMVTVSTVQALGKDRLTPIAVTSGKRDPSLPNVPTFAEAGASGYNANFWFGMFAPKGTPAEVVAKLNAVARQALTDPEVSKSHLGLGFVSSPTTPGEFAKIIASDSRKWAQVLEASAPK